MGASVCPCTSLARPAVAALALACALLAQAAGGDEPASHQVAARPVFHPTKEQLAALQFATVGLRRFRTERVTDGKIAIDADHATPVYSPLSGRVARVLAAPGDTVREGQPLLVVQASEFVQGQSDLRSAQATLRAAQAQLTNAEAIERRRHGLLEAGAGSQQDWDQSRSDLAQAQSGARAAQAALDAARSRLRILGQTDAQIDALAEGASADALSPVLAPIAGVVLDRQVGPGQYLQAGASNPVFTVGDLSTVWLLANVRELDAPWVRKGADVEVQVLALPGRSFHARITYVGAALDPATHRLPVRAQVANPDGLLKPEMFASFRLLDGAESSAPAVPESGVIYEGEQARVWVLGAEGNLTLRVIRPGRSSAGMLEVLEGVHAGEKVVAGGALFIDRALQGD